MRVANQITCDLPEYAVMAIEYGDTTGLDATDIANIDNWLDDLYKHGFRSPIFDYGHEAYFSTTPVFGLPAACVECTITQLEPD